jgi:ATP-binding cassette subfamily F protein 3
LQKFIQESEAKIEKMESRLKELDTILYQPENASNMTLINEYTEIKQKLDDETARWEENVEKMEKLQN